VPTGKVANAREGPNPRRNARDDTSACGRPRGESRKDSGCERRRRVVNATRSDAPLFLVGATGTGKSAAAMELARAWGGGERAAILCMDAMQVYRGADIGTSKPTATERMEIPHGGLDLVNFGASFDVAQYLAHAAEFLREQREAGRRVIVVGGTGLYFRALTRGLCEAPQGPDELRAELAALSVDDLRTRLEKVDPGMMEKLDAKNPRRLARAIEVMESTGKSLSEWQAATPEPLVRDFSAIWIQRQKVELEKRIEARVEAMFSEGWMDEVRGLVEKYGIETVRRFAGIGYGEIARGRDTLTELQRDIFVATRQYAKRQLTWFAREPILTEVMLTGNQSFPEALRAAALPRIL
jgi:tRNA dimethylallyltransferase